MCGDIRCIIRGLWSQEQLFLWHVQVITSHKQCMWDYLSMSNYICFWHHIPHMSKYNAPQATSTKYLGIFLVRFSYYASFIFALWHCYVYVLLFLPNLKTRLNYPWCTFSTAFMFTLSPDTKTNNFFLIMQVSMTSVHLIACFDIRCDANRHTKCRLQWFSCKQIGSI